MAKKVVSLEADLWDACNKLRGSVSATDYVNVVLGLFFLRFAFDKFNAQREKLLEDPETAPFAENARFYTKDNIFYLRDELEVLDHVELVDGEEKRITKT